MCLARQRWQGACGSGIVIRGLVAALFSINAISSNASSHLSDRRLASSSSSSSSSHGSSSAPDCSGSHDDIYHRRLGDDAIWHWASPNTHSRRLGGGPAWYCEDWEKDHVEALATMGMLLLALAFEKLHHHITHEAEDSFCFGKSRQSEEERHENHEKKKLHAFHEPLRLGLFGRMGCEFMVLGFLAFTIWCLNQQEVFDKLAELTAGDMHLPTQGVDYLHMMEFVHMQLFVAMIMYFALGLTVVEGADGRIASFQSSRGVWIEQIRARTAENYDTDDPNLLEFKKWRGHFLKGCAQEMYSWQSGPKATENSKKQFMDLMKKMHVNKDEGTVTMEDVSKCCTGRFSFCTYLVYSVCSAVGDITRMSSASLYTIIVIKTLLSVFHRAAHVPLSSLEIPLSMTCVCFISVLYRMTVLFKRALESWDYEIVKGLKWVPAFMDRINEYINPEAFWVLTLQVLMFFLCHTWAGSLISKDFWNRIFQKGEIIAILKAAGYIGVQISLMVVLPRFVPDFAAVMSLPPFFSQSNVGIVQSVASQVVDQAMVKAREEMSTSKKKSTLAKVRVSETTDGKDAAAPEKTTAEKVADKIASVAKVEIEAPENTKGKSQVDINGQDKKQGDMKNQIDTSPVKASSKEPHWSTESPTEKGKESSSKESSTKAKGKSLKSELAVPKRGFKKNGNKMPKTSRSNLDEVSDNAEHSARGLPKPQPSAVGKSIDKAKYESSG